MAAMEMLSGAALSYCHVGKNEVAACRSLLTLCKWLLADWKDMSPQLKQAGSPFNISLLLLRFFWNTYQYYYACGIIIDSICIILHRW